MTNFEISQLANQNIWWDDPKNISKDISIQKYEQKPLKWHPRILKDVESGKNNIYIIRGPRQVGKTTALKLLIRSKLLEQKLLPISLFYYTCDAIESYHDLIALLESYLNYARLSYQGELFIFLDEISDIDNWQKAIKFLVDTGRLNNTTLFLTGSNAYDLTHSAERLPGRRGTGSELDRIFYPLTFGDFLALIDDRLKALVEKCKPLEIDSITEMIKSETFRSLLANKQRIDLYFDQYLLTGGFITAINDFYQNENISPFIYEIYLQWVKGDFSLYMKQERFLKQIIRRMIVSLSSDIGWNTFTKDSEIGSHNTVIEYVDILESSYIARTIYNIDLNSKLANTRKNKKFYFVDNFIFHAFRGWLWAMNDSFKASKLLMENAVDKSKLIENCAMIHFYQHFKSELYFWKNKTEVDIVGKKNNQLYFIEIKYQKQPKLKYSEQFANQLKRPSLILTKDTFKIEKNYIMIPISLILAIL